MALPFFMAILAGCDPHDGSVNANYAMYFASATSDNILRTKAEEDPVTCSFEQSDPLSKDIDDTTIFTDDCWKQKVDAEKQYQEKWNLTPLDCRTFGGDPYGGNSIRIRDGIVPGWETEYEAYCCEESYDADTSNDPDGDMLTPDDCTVRQPKYLDWLTSKSFYLNTGKVESWREEAVLTAEGDLQFTIHMDTPFGDARFGFVVDPNFQPTQCVDVDGVSTEQSLWGDGDWVAGWSGAEADAGYTVYNINAGTYQINPNNTGEYWIFDEDWQAAAGYSRFADENAYIYSTDYADYTYDNDGNAVFDPYYVFRDDDGQVIPDAGYGSYGGEHYEELNCGGDGQDGCAQYKDYADFVEMLQDNFNNGGTDRDGNTVEPVDNELQNYGNLSQDDFNFHVRVEDNGWRQTLPGEGGDPQGLDGWSGVNPSYVRFKTTEEKLQAIEPGTLDSPLEGDFQLYLTSADTTGSVWFFSGSFTIETVERDTWGYSPELDVLKRDENSTPTCGE